MYYIPQVSKSGCGFACLKMLLAISHKDERYLYLKEDENRGNYSYLDLIKIAQHYNVTLMGANYPEKDDLRHLTRFPLILTVDNGNGAPHAVLVTKRRGKRIKVYDPEKGISWQKVSKFIKKWDGTGLSVTQVQERPFVERVIDVSEPKAEVFSYLFQTMAAVFLALATFFIKPDGSFLWPLLFLIVSVLCEIVLRT